MGLRLMHVLLILTGLLHAQQIWERNYGGAANERGYCVQQTTDGGYIVVGSTSSFGSGGNHVYLIKTNASGDSLWARFYGTMGGREVQQTQDSGYVIVGTTAPWPYAQIYLIKTNASGDTLWTRTYGGPSIGRGVHQTHDGGYIILEFRMIPEAERSYLIRTNAFGDTVWTRIIPDTDTIAVGGTCVRQTSDGGFVVVGRAAPHWKAYLVRTDTAGHTLWAHHYDNSHSGNSVQQTTDGGYIITGAYNCPVFNSQVYLIKTNASGDSLWARTYGGSADEEGNSVQQTTDGGYIIVGAINSDQVYLIKTNASGDTLWTRTYGGGGNDRGYSVKQTTDGGYIIAGTTSSFGKSDQVYLIKTDSLGNSAVHEDEFEIKKHSSFLTTIFSGPLRLPEGKNCRVFDITGRVVTPSKIGPGIYFIEVDGTIAQKVVKIR